MKKTKQQKIDEAYVPGTSDELAGYVNHRMAKSLKPGSQWAFFRDGDDPGAGHAIEIVRVEGKGASAQRFAKLCKGKRWDRQHPFGDEFPVNYSELW